MEALEAELVALESIYEGCLQVTDRPDCKLVAYHAPPLTVQFYVSADYPSGKPAHLIKQQGVPTSVLKSISRDLEQLLDELLGSECLFQAIEFVRERLREYTSQHGSTVAAEESRRDSDGRKEAETDREEAAAAAESKREHGESTIKIYSGSKIVDRKSIFQGHLAIVKSREEVEQFRAQLLTDRKIAKARHNMLAYRIRTPTGSIIYDNDEGEEAGAGRRLSELLEMMNAVNVAVIVTRWYGGIQLGPDRFRHISNAAREAEHLPAREGRAKQRWDGDLRLVAGCLPIHDGKVFMVKSRKKADWVLPKGGWESDETAQECALREAYEEAGLEGEIGELLYESEVIKKKSQSRVTWFLMNVTRVLDQWPENRPRCELSLEEAMRTCTRPEMLEAMRRYQSMLA